MNDLNDLAYFAARAAAERELSARAADPLVAAIHTKLAERYEQLASGPLPERPTLNIGTA